MVLLMDNAFDIINGVAVIGGKPVEHAEVNEESIFRGVHILLANGWSVSTQFGKGTYCDGGKTTAEVAIFDPAMEFFPLPGWTDDVKGHVTPDEVWSIVANTEKM